MNQPGAPSAGVAGGNDGGRGQGRTSRERSGGDDELAEGNERQGNSSDFVSFSFRDSKLLGKGANGAETGPKAV